MEGNYGASRGFVVRVLIADKHPYYPKIGYPLAGKSVYLIFTITQSLFCSKLTTKVNTNSHFI